jgi:hypothetical protein
LCKAFLLTKIIGKAEINMATAKPKKTDVELRRLKVALRENEKLMHEAAIHYEDLIAAKEDLTTAIKARKELRLKKAGSN